ncbi:phosphatase PAP2 family protein [Corynebacterium sp. ES2794-CONJ1]|uniref:phosphatase PAP2 family protein n=1 Tax=unclassified Corynebacterium TaxID=2624378 RepID=UPI00216A6E34|nr:MULTISPECIES: phosphatase PAP2 family protein [unclassified Corynebacterium]MCS4492063.1 phosphatase PAP2 family protein [Corynebacterium sp. ES2715-CONJ3]MCS4532171.1 phosphatase PAP2 family protein [Corynebacterium sp. ES2730-CONJ]MCU9519567.1 phosphatase PAP2 family protein [Corynebacterium sp. ES2794-CONJ1]
MDIVINNCFLALNDSPLTPAVIAFTTALRPVYLTISLFIMAVLWSCLPRLKSPLRVIFALPISVALASLSAEGIKMIIARPRPDIAGHLVEVTSFAFPSGHATAITACASMATIIWGWKKTWWTYIVAIAVYISRLYTGVHWMSDIIGGIILGLIISALIARLLGISRLSSRPEKHSEE